ncbi:hypothetical protein EEL53_10260 [Muribaculaceae bacterium Isolate-114 (HZI)]|nr:hypothetical protein EEL53_10260 [Muribaculaceae bacterium Isolate-114 (HZI)]
MKKIMFSDKFGLTEAVLSGRKTQTRRVVSESLWNKWTEYDDFCGSVGVRGLNEIGVAVTREYSDCEKFFLDNSPFKIGEVVAVAQSYHSFYNDECDPRLFPDGAGWTNKMFVRADLIPHQIRITNIRVERLQDISYEDCLAEGVEKIAECENLYRVAVHHKSGKFSYLSGKTPREAYAALIDRISGKGTFERNPYVFVYEFELIK